MEANMNWKSLIPVGRERAGVARREVNPFVSLQQEVERLFDDFARGFPAFGSAGLVPNMDVMETDKEIELAVELPGLEEKDVQINLADNVLTIRGEKKAEKEEKDKNYRLLERSYGSFTRSVELPASIDPDKIKATITNGVLTVKVPKPAAAVAKKIEVKTAA
jgi:HSP20 family protein